MYSLVSCPQRRSKVSRQSWARHGVVDVSPSFEALAVPLAAEIAGSRQAVYQVHPMQVPVLG